MFFKGASILLLGTAHEKELEHFQKKLVQLQKEADHLRNAPKTGIQFAYALSVHLPDVDITAACFEYLLVRVLITVELCLFPFEHPKRKSHIVSTSTESTIKISLRKKNRDGFTPTTKHISGGRKRGSYGNAQHEL